MNSPCNEWARSATLRHLRKRKHRIWERGVSPPSSPQSWSSPPTVWTLFSEVSPERTPQTGGLTVRPFYPVLMAAIFSCCWQLLVLRARYLPASFLQPSPSILGSAITLAAFPPAHVPTFHVSGMGVFQMKCWVCLDFLGQHLFLSGSA